MTTNSDERLSALLDGELDAREERQALDAIIGADLDERARFGRYRLIGDVMRGEAPLLGSGIQASVTAAIAAEPTVLAPRPAKPRRLARPLAGLAVAASVATAAVVVAPQFLGSPAGPGIGGETIANTPASPAMQSQPPVVTVAKTVPGGSAAQTRNWQTLDPALGERLNRLVIEHHEFGGRTGVNGPVAHIGLVNYAGR